MNNESKRTDQDFVEVSNSTKSKYVKELKLDRKRIKEFVKRKKDSKKGRKKKTELSTYKTNFYAKLSNFFMENISFYIAGKFKGYFAPLLKALTASNLRVLSRTYISMILFSALLAFPVSLIVSYFFLFNVFLSLFISVLISVFVFLMVYSYPFIIANDRKHKISQELVFAEVHMAAVAGSGAHPVKIFQLLVESKEYEVLNEELKRVLNYINIFGYSLSNALKSVALTTPSPELKELFYGMISSIETGGDIRQYLADKSSDTLTKYRFSQKRHLESISTYSEIYTGFLIAGPLLFVVTLAILEKVSPVIAGVPISTLSTLGTFILLPVLNILFILFLETMRSDI
jgi:archaeal flagellar protein FlaJ